MLCKKWKAINVDIPSTEGRLLAQLKNETILRKLQFNEESEMYECRGILFNGSSNCRTTTNLQK